MEPKRKTMGRFWRQVGLFAALLTAVPLFMYGAYLLEDFTTATPAGWLLDYRYGRGGISLNTDLLTVSVDTAGTGTLQFRGRVNTASSDYLGVWAGRMAFYTNRSFVASATNPFGVEFRRTYAHLDPHNDTSNDESHRHQVANSFWLVQVPAILNDTSSDPFVTYPNAVVMYEMMRMDYNYLSSQPRSSWGYSVVSEQPFDMTAGTDNSGVVRDLTTGIAAGYGIPWNYDDSWGVGTQDGAGAPNGLSINNNSMIIRMTHDGSTVRLYINPNPDGSNSYRNEFILLQTVQVGWSDDIMIMTGVESKRTDTENQDVDIDSVLIRPVSSGITAEITPARVANGSTNWYEIVMNPVFAASDAGIGELIISKPERFSSINWNPSEVQVYSVKGTGATHSELTALKLMGYVSSVPTQNSNFYAVATNSGRDLYIKFDQTKSDLTGGGVINSQAADSRIVVRFRMPVPADANSSGDTFTVYADCRKYHGESYPRWATTGRQLATAGDALNSTGYSENTLTVKSYSNPDLLGTMTPDLIYVGTDKVLYYYITLTNVNAPGLSELRITVPPGYLVNTNDSSGFQSLFIANDAQFVYATNIKGTNFVIAEYKNDGSLLPSPGGLDRITIPVQQTPGGFTGAQTNTLWSATGYSDVSGTTPATARTNQEYYNNVVVVRQPPPTALAQLRTDNEGVTNTLYNHINVNTITYTIENGGPAGNDIKLARLQFPEAVSGVSAVQSSIISNLSYSYDAGTRQLTLLYTNQGTNIPSGYNDQLSITISDTVPALSGLSNGNITAAVNNLNGDGYVPASTNSAGWTLIWKNPAASGTSALQVQNGLSSGSTNRVYTTDDSYSVRISVNNNGGSGNEIRMVEIIFPASITNISFTSASILKSSANFVSSGNRVRINYYNDLSSAISNASTELLTVNLRDNLTLSQVTVLTMQVRVANTSDTNDFEDTGIYAAGSKRIQVITPPVAATGYAFVDGDTSQYTNLIDSSTSTNTIVYVLSNAGVASNVIGELRLYIPDTISSNILNNATSSFIGSTSDVSPYISVSNSEFSNFVRIVYPSGLSLAGGQTETVRFTIVDHIEDQTNLQITATVSNIQNVWTVPAVPSGRTNMLYLKIPPARGAFYLQPNIVFASTNGTVSEVLKLVVSNAASGVNNITNVAINYPSLLNGKISTASNLRGSSGVAVSGGYRFDYTSLPLQTSQTDTIFFVIQNDLTASATTAGFTGTVDNGQGPQSIYTLTGKSSTFQVVDRPRISIAKSSGTPNTVFTTDVFNEFVLNLHNGSVGGAGIKKAKIVIPYPFVTNGMIYNSPTAGAVEALTGSNELTIDYSMIPLSGGSVDNIALRVQDQLTNGTTNVQWTVFVDYGDGYGFRPTAVADGLTNGISFVFPDPSALARIQPRTVNMNSLVTSYTLTVTNTGVAGNHIKKVKIDTGVTVTNISNIQSSTPGAAASVISNRYIVMDYSAVASNLQAPGFDVIRYDAYDAVTTVSNQTVAVSVMNNADGAAYIAAAPAATGSLDISYYQPDYLATAYLTANNAVSSELTNTVFSSVTTSTLQLHLRNSGGAGNNLEVLKLEIPDPWFNAASIRYISSQKVASNRISLSNTTLFVYYTNGDALQSGMMDTITFVIDDTVASTNGSVLWNSSARFTTSAGVYIANRATAGKTNRIYFQMPAPAAAAAVSGTAFYTSTGPVALDMFITNTGSGSNSITSLLLAIPAGLQAGVGVHSISNSSATSVSYNSGTFTLIYSGLQPGSTDSFRLYLTNTVTSLTSFVLGATVNNGVYSGAVQALSNNAMTLRIDTPPAWYLVDKTLDSSTVSNLIRLKIENNSSGTTPVRQAVITVPAVFTNVAAVSNSAAGAVITNSGNSYYVTYSGAGLARGGSDTVSFYLMDSITDADATAAWSVSVNNGTGFAAGNASAADMLSVFTMPVPAVGAIIGSGQKIYTTTGIFQTSFTVTNKASGSNRLQELLITVPENFRTALTPGSIRQTTATGVQYQSGIFRLNYAGLLPGQTDSIQIVMTNSYSVTSRPVWQLSALNQSKTAAVTENVTGGLQSMVDTPAQTAVSPNLLDTASLSNVVAVTVNNNSSGDAGIRMIRITVPAQFTNTVFLSNTSGAPLTNNGNTWFVNYASAPLLLDQQDKIWFRLTDNVTGGDLDTGWTIELDNGSGFAAALPATAGSWSNNFRMPAPAAACAVGQREIYTATGNFKTVFTVSNTGTGSNLLKRVLITVPEMMRDGFTPLNMSNSLATNVAYSSGVITLEYAGLVPGAVDTVYMTLTNRYTQSQTVAWGVSLDNGTRTASGSSSCTGSLQQTIVTPPSTGVTVLNPRDGVANRLYSTDYQGVYRLELRHDGSGTSKVDRVLIQLPDGFQMTATSTRVVPAWISNTATNSVLVNYLGAGKSLSPGESDQLQLTAIDPWHSGNTNIQVKVYMNRIDPAGLNPGYDTVRTLSGKTVQVDFVHPAPASEWAVTGFDANEKPSVIVADRRQLVMQTNLQITVKNNGQYSNVLHYVAVDIPAVFTTVGFLSNDFSGVTVTTNGNRLVMQYPAGLVAGASDRIHFSVQYTQQEETNNLPFQVSVDNGNGSGYVSAPLQSSAFGVIDFKYSPIAVFAGLKNTTNVYTLNTNATLEYLIKNRAQGYKITATMISNFDMSAFSSVQAVSAKGATVQVVPASNMIYLVYGSSKMIDYNDSDSIQINLVLKTNLASGFTTTLTMQNVTWLSNPNPPDYKSTNVDARNLDAIDTDMGSRNNQLLLVGPAPYSMLTGFAVPTFKIDTKNSNTFLPNIVKVELLDKTTDTVVATPFAQEIGADGTPQNKSLLAYSEPTTGGAYALQYLPPGEYRLRYTSTGFQKVVTNVTFVANTRYTLPAVSMKNSLLDSGISSEQLVVNYDDTNTRFILPANGMLDQFGLNISVVDMSAAQQSAVQSANSVLQPSDVSLLRCFRFEIFNRLGSSLSGLGIGGDGTLVLNYSNMNLRIPIPENTSTADEWQSSQLAVYYWKAATSTWVPVGGTVSQTGGVVTARVNYLHDYYALLAVKPSVAAKKIYNVTATPKVFTPGHGDESSNTMKLTFSFSQPHATYTVQIFDMRGRLVRKFVRDGSYSQGEVFWDGKDENGFRLAGGVYLYQIKAGGEVFTGTVLMLK